MRGLGYCVECKHHRVNLYMFREDRAREEHVCVHLDIIEMRDPVTGDKMYPLGRACRAIRDGAYSFECPLFEAAE